MQVEGSFIWHVCAHDIHIAGVVHQLDKVCDILHLAGRKEVIMCDIHHMARDAEADLEAIESWQHMDIRGFLTGRILQHLIDSTLERRHINIHVPLLGETLLSIVCNTIVFQKAHAEVFFFAEQKLDFLI